MGKEGPRGPTRWGGGQARGGGASGLGLRLWGSAVALCFPLSVRRGKSRVAAEMGKRVRRKQVRRGQSNAPMGQVVEEERRAALQMPGTLPAAGPAGLACRGHCEPTPPFPLVCSSHCPPTPFSLGRSEAHLLSPGTPVWTTGVMQGLF